MNKRLFLFVLLLTATGCTGMNNTEQRMVSGAAIGGTLGGFVGAGIGAGVGWLIDIGDRPRSHVYLYQTDP